LAELEDEIEALLAHEQGNSESASERASEEPTPTGARRRVRNPEQGNSIGASIAASQSPATFRADLEDLLPFVSPKSSVPPVLPALPEKAEVRTQDPKRNRLSFVIFGAMLLASIVPLVRYSATGAHQEPVPKAITPTNFEQIEAKHAEATSAVLVAGEPARSNPNSGTQGTASTASEAAPNTAPNGAMPEKPPADPMLEALARAEADLPANSVAAADQLMSQGLKALAAGDERFAEALLGRALKRDDDNPRAYFALARIRLSQGNLQGAEGWIVSALHKRPRRAEYHALYATVLEGLGRTVEAATARARAEELRSAQTESAPTESPEAEP
jgi:hypothetical protein